MVIGSVPFSTGNTISFLGFCTAGDGIDTKVSISSPLNTFRSSIYRFSFETSYTSFSTFSITTVFPEVDRSSVVFLSSGATGNRRDVPSIPSSSTLSFRFQSNGSTAYIVTKFSDKSPSSFTTAG